MSRERNNERLVVLFFIGVLVLNYPFLHLFGAASLWLDFPVLYLYLFICWLAFIMLMALLMERRSRGERDPLHANHRRG